MTVQLTISGEAHTDFLAQFRGVASAFAPDAANAPVGRLNVPDVVDPAPTVAPPAPEAEGTKGRGRGRPKKEPDPAAPPATSAEAPATAPEVTAADAAQDAADEAAESAKPPEAPKTTDDVRAAMQAYMRKFGMPAAQADLSQVWAAAGVKAAKLSEIVSPDDCAAAVAAIMTAVDDNPFDRALAEGA